MAAPLTARRAFLTSLVLLLLAGLLLRLLERGEGEVLPAGRLDRLPLRLGGWSGAELAVSDRERAALGTENLILRLYRKGERSLYLYVLECSSNREAFHPPEYCYVGGRTEMVERGRVPVRWEGGEILAHRLVFLGPRGRSLVYYWYTFGEDFMGSYYLQQLRIIAATLLGRRRPALLVRVSNEGEIDPEAGDGAIADFAGSLIPALEQYLLDPL